MSSDQRAEVAAAFALDTAAAALACESVHAVLAITDDHRFARRLAALGCSVIPDGVSNDLNGSLRLAAAEAVRRWPGCLPVAVTADLPALRPAELAQALLSIGHRPAFVRDLAGTGTTLYAAAPHHFKPCFGPDSARAHASSGAVEIAQTCASLRQDVDTLSDLRAATALGLGSHTAAAAPLR